MEQKTRGERSMASRAQIKASVKYNKEKTILVSIRLNKETDKDIITRLRSPVDINGSKSGYIKQLIREDIRRDSIN